MSQAVGAPAERSLSAVTWNLLAHVEGFELARHTVFFSPSCEAEFDQIVRQRQLPQRATVYVCAQDRDDRGLRQLHQVEAPERLLCLVNAPAIGGEAMVLGGDILLSVAGIPAGSAANIRKIRDMLGAAKPGTEFKGTVLRAGRVLEMSGRMP